MEIRQDDSNKTRLFPLSGQVALASALGLSLLIVLAIALARPFSLIVFGAAFLCAWAVTAIAFWARIEITNSDHYRGERLAILTILFGQAIALLLFLAAANEVFNVVLTHLIFWPWLILLTCYLLAVSSPGARLIVIGSFFALIPLSLLTTYLVQSRDEARSNQRDKNAVDTYRAFRQHQETIGD